MNSEALNDRRLVSALLVILLVGAISSQYWYDYWRTHFPHHLSVTYDEYIEPQPLSGNTAKIASFGQNDFLANLYWLELIQYYGGGEPSGHYRQLANLYNTVTDLSPKFLYAYQSGLLVLPGEGFADQAIALGKKGEQNLPSSWEIPYYLGMDYYIYKKDYASAAIEFDKAAKIPGAPASTSYFAAIYYKDANKRDVAFNIFKTIYETTDDSYLKDRAKKYMDDITILYGLDIAINTFRSHFHRNPTSLQELVDKKIISAITDSPLGFTYHYDPTSGTVSETK